MRRENWAIPTGSKKVHRWLLLSEAGSSSKAHIDAGFATWFRCLKGKKSVWLRNNLTAMDKEV